MRVAFLDKGDRQPVSFSFELLSHLFHYGDWDLCFFPVSWELFDFETGQYRIDNRCVRFFTFCVQGSHWLLISPFLAFSVLLALLLRCCFSAG